MYSPTFKPDPQSPMMSPMSFYLDDSKNNIQQLLLSPTKLKLDPVGNSSVYRTSLSKLNEMTRTGRSSQRRNSDTFRSTSPIRFPLMNNIAPKMLKPEYIAAPQASALPLLSTLMKHSSKNTKNMSQSNNQQKTSSNQNNNSIPPPSNSEANPFQSRMTIKETLEQINVQKQRYQTKEIPEMSSRKFQDERTEKFRNVSNTDSTLSGSTLNDNISNNIEPEPLKLEQKIQQEIPVTQASKQNNRIVSHGSAGNINQMEFDDIPQEINVDCLPTDRNGFVQLNNKGNRYSFISSASTDFEIDWYNQLQQQQTVQLHQQSPRFPAPSKSESDESIKNELRIKRLELEIGELKLQNEKLIHSLLVTEKTEKAMSPNSDGYHVRHHKKKNMQNKVDRLEKKIDRYRSMMNKLVDMHSSISVHHNSSNNNNQYGNIDETSSVRTRISRISDADLQRIQDSASSGSSSSELDEDDENDEDEELEDEEELLENLSRINDLNDMSNITFITKDSENTLERHKSLKRESTIGSKKKVGFHLNLQFEK
ncbi:hypothetical protein Kpol_530p17 [Vanderwaltozyma polyspora DSM 70294]|uniref:Uncharacterized protein n=1 Tax=Vanderwaltozyma polyspora (strain ATCC 22028 / DSM 70294 / BCRC 21397 / CBS 2163 / NBRC 10782 / NRRL Y-8283 / UCD 57-17) TaxID=436907 RepID=A7TKZ1_VANPO|nr:uncharacterized protein Kpol_530p17 [Vanderwaltozyma polyspora DSM 70294]EDO17047.1 hypothetical protein Kpol_530p17 [Vanderwaltozyma polyspora DSM 70294]